VFCAQHTGLPMMVLEHQRASDMLETLQRKDPDITIIVTFSKFVVVYVLQKDGSNPSWRRTNVQGSVLLVQRNSTPRYQLILKNQSDTQDLVDNLHPDWELDCQENYIFYKVEDPHQLIRGLWFHDDVERQKLEASLEKALGEIRPSAELQTAPQPQKAEPNLQSLQETDKFSAAAAQVDATVVQNRRLASNEAVSQDTVTVSVTSVRAAAHALADDEDFLKMIIQKIQTVQLAA